MRVHHRAAVRTPPGTAAQETGMPATTRSKLSSPAWLNLGPGAAQPGDCSLLATLAVALSKRCTSATQTLMSAHKATCLQSRVPASDTNVAGTLHEAASTTLLPLLFAHLSCCPNQPGIQCLADSQKLECLRMGAGSQNRCQRHGQPLTKLLQDQTHMCCHTCGSARRCWPHNCMQSDDAAFAKV